VTAPSCHEFCWAGRATLIAVLPETFTTQLGRACRFGFIVCLILVCSASAPHAKADHRPQAWGVRWEPAKLINGSPILFKVVPPVRLESLTGMWLDHQVFFSFDARNKLWFGIAGASLETPVGRFPLSLTGKTAAGQAVSFVQQLAIAKGRYRQVVLTVPKQFTEPTPEQRDEIRQEQELKHEVFARVDPKREWSGDFLPPVRASITDVFGTARVFNGSTQSVHEGLDYGVPSNTPVMALNNGTVLLARPLFFEGNCVVLNHGQGLLTLYMHLSKMEVKEGDHVLRGQEIALSGGTGRATGPHLHLAVRWEGVYLNPATLLGLQVP
jgi:murein DD-endopeptidase MepM/ murein hydrolase activator NlpD